MLTRRLLSALVLLACGCSSEHAPAMFTELDAGLDLLGGEDTSDAPVTADAGIEQGERSPHWLIYGGLDDRGDLHAIDLVGLENSEPVTLNAPLGDDEGVSGSPSFPEPDGRPFGWSADSNAFAYVVSTAHRDPTLNRWSDELFVVDMRGARPGSPVRLALPLTSTQLLPEIVEAHWSPVGSRLSFVVVDSEQGTGPLYVVDALEPAAEEQLPLQIGDEDLPVLTSQWSPDGTQLAVVTSVPDAELISQQRFFVIDMSQHHPDAQAPPARELLFRPGHTGVLWSPDSRKIALEHSGDGVVAVFDTQEEGSELHGSTVASAIFASELNWYGERDEQLAMREGAAQIVGRAVNETLVYVANDALFWLDPQQERPVHLGDFVAFNNSDRQVSIAPDGRSVAFQPDAWRAQHTIVQLDDSADTTVSRTIELSETGIVLGVPHWSWTRDSRSLVVAIEDVAAEKDPFTLELLSLDAQDAPARTLLASSGMRSVDALYVQP